VVVKVIALRSDYVDGLDKIAGSPKVALMFLWRCGADSKKPLDH